MAANVLNSQRAMEVSVFVIRAFVRLRHAVASHREFARKLAGLERKVAGHDAALQELVNGIRQLMEPAVKPPRRRIGFRPRRS